MSALAELIERAAHKNPWRPQRVARPWSEAERAYALAYAKAIIKREQRRKFFRGISPFRRPNLSAFLRALESSRGRD